MDDLITPKAGTVPVNPCLNLGRERLLGVPEICALTGFADVVAADIIKESGHCIRMHKRLFILESSFFDYLHDLEMMQK